VGIGLLAAPPAVAAAPGAPAGLTVSQPNDSTSMLSWNAVGGAAKYDVVVDDDPSFGTPYASVQTVNNTYVPTMNLNAGTNYWRVRALNVGNEASAWSTGSFGNPEVKVPVPASPADGATLVQPANPPLLSWSGSPGATSYTVEVDGEPDFVGAKSYSTKTTSLVVPDPLGAGDYWWRVTAVKGPGLISQPSASASFIIGALPAPVLVSPNNSANEPVEDVVLDWHPVPGAKTYEVQVANNVDFTNITETKTGIRGTRYSPPAGYNNDQYYWRVRAIDLGGAPTPWAQSQFNFKRHWPDRPWPVFPVQDGLPLTPDNANHDPADLPIEIMTTPAPFFQWMPVQHASHYQLQVDTQENFSSADLETCQIAGTTYTPGNGVFRTTSFTRSIDEECLVREGALLYWRVRPMDEPFNGTGFPNGVEGIYSPTQRFVWDPAMFTNVSPTEEAVVDIPTLRWQPQMGAEKFEVSITNRVGATVLPTTTTYATSYTLVDKQRLNPADGPFTWRIAAIEAGGRSSALADHVFNVSGSIPTTGAAPLTALSGTSADAPTVRAPALRWEPMDDAEYYRVSMGDSGSGFFWVPTFGEALGKKLYYPAMTETGTRSLKPGSYDWVVEAFAADGAKIGQSAVNTLRISGFEEVSGQRIALDGQTLDSGGGCAARLDNGAFCSGVPSTPVLSWDHQPGMSFYVVYVSQDANFTNLTETTRIPDTWNTRYAFTFSNNRPALPDNQSGVPYYWHIRPCKAIGVCGPDPVSNATSLAEHAFLKVSPRVNLTQPGVGASVDTNEITFDWDDYFDTNQATPWLTEMSPQSAKWYRLQVDNSDNFSAPFVDDIKVDQSTYTAFSKLYPEGTLFWRVAAIDGADNELNWSLPRSFTKGSPAVGLSSPVGDAAVGGTTPFTWGSQGFTGSYTIEVYRNNDLTFSSANRLFSKTVLTPAYAWDSPVPVSPAPYVWRVRRTDADGNEGPWSERGRFIVSAGAINLTSPADGGSQPPNGPVLTWTPLAGATSYTVEIRPASGSGSTTTANTVASAFAATTNFVSGTYIWTVTAKDASGSAVGSGQATFSVNNQLVAAQATQISAPAGTGVGATLTSTAPAWNQPDVSNAYQWLRDGSPISGATSATYTLTTTDYGKAVSLRVTAKRPGFADGVSVSNTIGATAGGALVATAPPTITGTPAGGSTLTAKPGTWTGPPTSYKYQWLRNGAPIPGAVSTTYKLTPDDAAKTIAVAVLASRAGFNDGAATAAAVSVPKMTSTTSATLSITRVKVGKRVKIGIAVTVPGVAGPSGKIRILDGTKTLKTLTMGPAAKGKITYKLPRLKKGRHKIKAAYFGNLTTYPSKSRKVVLAVFR
jgi:hypothetical protein